MVRKRLKRSEVKASYREYKKTLKCSRCGYDDYRALEFHHTDDNKDGTIGDNLGNWSLERIMKEIDKCEVLCANCHRIEHYGV